MPKVGEISSLLKKYFGKEVDAWFGKAGLDPEADLDDVATTRLYEAMKETIGPEEATNALMRVGLVRWVHRLKLFISGNAAVGKTSFCRRFALGAFDRSYKSTIGVDFYSKDIIVNHHIVKLLIWDLAGQERFGIMRPSFYSGAAGGFVAFSMVDEQSVKDIPGWVEEAQTNIGPVPMLLVGTKSDLGSKISDDPRSYKEKFEFLSYTETSALTGENIDDAVRLLCRKIMASS